jgi:hypothetical protein
MESAGDGVLPHARIRSALNTACGAITPEGQGFAKVMVCFDPCLKRECDLFAALRPIHRVKRAAQALMPPFVRMNWSSGSESGL